MTKLRRGKTLYLSRAVAEVFDPLCRTALADGDSGALGDDTQQLLAHLRDFGPTDVDDVRDVLAFERTPFRNLRKRLETSGALISKERRMDSRGTHRHFSVLFRWDQIGVKAAAEDASQGLENAVTVGVRAAVIAQPADVQRWFSWRVNQSLLTRLVEQGRLIALGRWRPRRAGPLTIVCGVITKASSRPDDFKLRLACDSQRGLHRVGGAGNFSYTDAGGRTVADSGVLGRIRSLAIPPAWTSVWIAPDADAHLQATGVDSRGRKQYRYHPEWRQEREHLKFHDMEAFAEAQPRLRRRIDSELGEEGELLSHRRVLALSLRLLDIGLLRIGSDRYARDNQHYGLTTLLRHQVTVRADSVVFDFVGKAGRRHQIAISDPQSLRLLASLKRRRGDPLELLVFRGLHGWTRVHREDVNNFLRATAGGPFSAKEYRTWNATVIAATTLAAHQPRVAQAAVVASAAVAAALGNTPTVARQSYIDPRVFDRYASGSTVALDGLPADAGQARARIENRVLAMLKG